MNQGHGGWPIPVPTATLGKIRSYRVGVDGPPVGAIVLGDIPQKYRHISLTFVGRTDAAAVDARMVLQPNGDITTAHFEAQQVSGSNTSTSAVIQTDNAGFMLGDISGTSIGTGRPAVVRATVFDYSNTFLDRVCISNTGHTSATAAQNVSSQYVSTWLNSTDPIRSLILSLASGNFIVGSVVDLYGEF